MIDTLVEQEQDLVDAELRGTSGRLRGKGGADTFVISYRCTSRATLVRGALVFKHLRVPTLVTCLFSFFCGCLDHDSAPFCTV